MSVSSAPLLSAAPHDSRICIIGAGPAGVHMASCLAKLGLSRLTILERGDKEEGRFGKTCSHRCAETADLPHEMGTCYLSWSYSAVRALIGEYLGPGATIEPGGGRGMPFGGLHLPSPKLDREKGYMTQEADQWLFAHSERVNVQCRWLWPLLPDKLQAVRFALDVGRYARLHECLLGSYDYHGLPPKPSAAAMEQMNKTFRELMVGNSLEALLDLCCVGFGSYGFGYDVPALYGLWFVTPPSVRAYIEGKSDKSVKLVQLVRQGYAALWQEMVEKHRLKIRHGASIKAINRNLGVQGRPIEIDVSFGNTQEVIECDYLMFAAPITELPKVVIDATAFEIKCAKHIVSVGLTVSLFKTEKKPPIELSDSCYPKRRVEEVGLTFYPESLQPEYTPEPGLHGEVYAERNTVRCYDWENDGKHAKRYVATYQYQRAFQPGEEARLARQARDFITASDMVITPTPSDPEPELLRQDNWDYFPHFTREGVMKYLPWEVFEAQGAERTFYLGSSVSFESAEDVVKYNLQVLRAQGFSITNSSSVEAIPI